MQSHGSLRQLTCDAVVELDADLRMANHSADLAAILLPAEMKSTFVSGFRISLVNSREVLIHQTSLMRNPARLRDRPGLSLAGMRFEEFLAGPASLRNS